MKIGPKYKICRRLGSDVFEKCQTQKYLLNESRKARTTRRGKRRKILSDYGKQLLEKQKVRFTYGLSEGQFKRYVGEAVKRRDADSAEALFQRLEMRLDNVVYRTGLASTRRMARQMVSHGHITVNGKKMTVPSYEVKVGSKVAVRPQSRDKDLFADIEERLKEVSHPSWLKFDEKSLEATILGKPQTEAMESILNLGVVIEFYSK